MGRVTFTEYFHLLLTGSEPTDDQRFFLDLLLVGIAEHGLMPSVAAARMTLAADPGSLQGAVAAGALPLRAGVVAATPPGPPLPAGGPAPGGGPSPAWNRPARAFSSSRPTCP